MASLYFSLLVGAAVVLRVAIAQSSLSEADKQAILNAHNYFRSRVNPTATNMEKMVWNDELANVAQEYADNCVFNHNSLRSDQSPSFSYVGENLFISSGSATNYTAYVEGWFNEVQVYNYNSNQCSGVCGHYTQVVWAGSDNLGCGAYRCATTVGFGGTNALNFVCNYGPGGNVNGARPYLSSGSVCSQCPSEKPSCQSNLCTFVGDNDNSKGLTVVQPLSFLVTVAVAMIGFMLR